MVFLADIVCLINISIMKIYKIILILFLILTMSVGYGQSDTLVLEAFTVNGTKVKMGTKHCLHAQRFDLDTPHDVGEIFKKEAGFSLVKRGNFAVEPVLRGFKYDQLNVQVDGGMHMDNACPNRMDPVTAHIMPEEIEKVEVIKGPYSVRHGQNVGGVINLITKHPVVTNQFQVKGTINATYQSNGNNKATSADIRLSSKRFDVSMYAGWKDFGNYKSGDGNPIWSSFRNYDYAVKAGYSPNATNRFQITWRQGFGRDIMHAGLPMDADKDDGSSIAIDYYGQNISNTIFSLKAKIYASYVDHLMSNRLRPNSGMMLGITPVTSQTIGGRIEAGVNLNSKNSLFAGIDFKQVKKDGTKHVEIYKKKVGDSIIVFPNPMEKDIKVWQNSYVNDLGFFVEDHSTLSSKLTWTLGMRADLISSEILDPADNFKALYEGSIVPGKEFNVSANSMFNYKLNDKCSLQWAVGRGMRTADLQERYIDYFTVGADAFQYVGNPYLKPEVNYQTDLIFRYNSESYGFYIDGFYAYMTDYITAKVDTSLPALGSMTEIMYAKRFVNIDKATKYGLEAGMQVVPVKNLTCEANLAYTYAQNLDMDEPLPEIPPLMVNTSISYQYKSLKTSLSARIASKQDRISSSFKESETPGFKVIDFHFTYDISKHLRLHTSITNLLNENYYEHLSRSYKNWGDNSGMAYYEPGRSFNVSLRIMF